MHVASISFTKNFGTILNCKYKLNVMLQKNDPTKYLSIFFVKPYEMFKMTSIWFTLTNTDYKVKQH